MIILRQHRISRLDIRSNPNVLYIFGDNLERVGYGGQAKEMRGEPNSFGIATKRKMAHGTDDCYFFDTDPDARTILINEFNNCHIHIRKNDYKGIIIPRDGIGTGLSKLPEYAPHLLDFINENLKLLENL